MSKLMEWRNYWIFYSILWSVYYVLYFFPFAYELRVIGVFLMAHPETQAATKIHDYFVSNPWIIIKMIDFRNKLRYRIDNEWLPALKEFRF